MTDVGWPSGGGPAFVDEEMGRINAQFRAIPPQWNGKFQLFDRLPKNGEEGDEPY